MKSTHGPTRGPFKPTASAVEYRRPLFAVGRGRVTEGAAPAIRGSASFGSVRVIRGGVTQHHRDLLDVIRCVAEHRVIDGGGQEHLIFDSARVRAMLPGRVGWRDIRESLLDMLTTVVQIDSDTPGAWGAAFPLATFVGDANSDAARMPHQFPARLKRLVLSAGFSGLLEQHATITLSKSVLNGVLGLRWPISRAVARWCLSHSGRQHHDLGRVLAAVGVVEEGEPVAGRDARSATRRLVQQLGEDAAGLAALGIDVDGMRMHYTRKKGVFITAPDGGADKSPGGADKSPGGADKSPGP